MLLAAPPPQLCCDCDSHFSLTSPSTGAAHPTPSPPPRSFAIPHPGHQARELVPLPARWAGATPLRRLPSRTPSSSLFDFDAGLPDLQDLDDVDWSKLLPRVMSLAQLARRFPVPSPCQASPPLRHSLLLATY